MTLFNKRAMSAANSPLPMINHIRSAFFGTALWSGLLLLGACNGPATGESEAPSSVSFRNIQLQYPPSPRDTTVTDTYCGKTVADPYRWLEDDHSEATASWVRNQQRLAKAYFEEIPYRDAFARRLAELWDFPRQGRPEYRGDYYYSFSNNGRQNQDVLTRTASLRDTFQTVLDPNSWSAGGTAAMGEHAYSEDGTLLAYQVSEAGSDWRNILVYDLEKGRALEDTLRWVKFSAIAWHDDGFYYSRYPEPSAESRLSGVNEFHQLYFHRVGQSQAEDELVFADRRHPRRNVRAETDQAERFLVLSVTESTSGNALYFEDLSLKAREGFVPVVEDFEHDYELVGSVADKLLVLTNDGAPRRRLVQISSRRPERDFWEEIIPERSDVLQDVELIGDKLIATYLHDASHRILIFNLAGKELKALKLPSLGTVTGFSPGRRDEAFFGFTSFTQPETVYRLQLSDFSTSIFERPRVAFASSEYETKQVWYESHDGTSVPMFIIHKKGLEPDGETPTLLYGYGGFNISILPRWNLTRLLLIPAVLENGGIAAVANIRGGGEFGAAWHDGGRLENKQNVFDDFQAAAEYLIAQGYTNSEKLGIYGRSNGGLLVGACLTQRPDLYKVAIPAVGVLDMLRYQNFTIGWAWAADYGLSTDSTMCDYLLSYSPLHNVEALRYPATLITTADHDDRVAPAHSFKFGATLQRQQQGEAPIVLRIDENTGHGAGKPVDKRIAEGADVMAFLWYNLQEQTSYR